MPIAPFRAMPSVMLSNVPSGGLRNAHANLDTAAIREV
jgi:hypothetical protein